MWRLRLSHGMRAASAWTSGGALGPSHNTVRKPNGPMEKPRAGVLLPAPSEVPGHIGLQPGEPDHLQVIPASTSRAPR